MASDAPILYRQILPAIPSPYGSGSIVFTTKPYLPDLIETVAVPVPCCRPIWEEYRTEYVLVSASLSPPYSFFLSRVVHYSGVKRGFAKKISTTFACCLPSFRFLHPSINQSILLLAIAPPGEHPGTSFSTAVARECG